MRPPGAWSGTRRRSPLHTPPTQLTSSRPDVATVSKGPCIVCGGLTAPTPCVRPPYMLSVLYAIKVVFSPKYPEQLWMRLISKK